MSNQFAIAGVTAVLQGALFEVYSNYLAAFDGGKVTVSAVAPDIVQGQVGDSTNSGSQVNLFLHQVTLNSGWRNVGLPSVDASGKNRLKNPPLALDLHYLLTVYGSSDAQAEALLGFAVLFLHENPVISRTGILNALNNLSSHLYSANFLTALSSSGIADQIEMIKLVPDTLGREEVAWLWTALKADYRPTFPFQASVVLIQPDQSDTLPSLSSAEIFRFLRARFCRSHPSPCQTPTVRRRRAMSSKLTAPRSPQSRRFCSPTAGSEFNGRSRRPR